MEKIPILGIENAGKTSLIQTFRREFQTLSKIKPTKRVDRVKLTLINKEISIWDFGGQAKYRKKHLNKADINFSDVNECFYVVDLQDQSSYNDSINYFQMIRTALLEYSPEVTVNILIHKIDPEMDENIEIQQLAETVESKFLNLADPLNVRVYRTSIFNPISVIHAFSKAITGNSILSDNLNVVFQTFIEKQKYEQIIPFIIIYSAEFVEVGSYFKENLNQTVLKQSAEDLFKVFDQKHFQLNDADLVLQIEDSKYDVRIKKNENQSKQYYLIIGYDKSAIYDMNEFNQKISNLNKETEKLMLFF